MQLLCLTDRLLETALPGLELLAHSTRLSPLGVRVAPSLAARFDVVLVDGGTDIRRARAVCLEWPPDAGPPLVLVAPQSAFPAVTPEWGIADVVLPDAAPAEIDLRLRLASQAAPRRPERSDETVRIAGVEIDESTYTARVQGRTLDLTYKEFELLLFLAAHPSRVFTREQLLDQVWGADYFGGVRTVDVHVRRLRAKLGDHETLISTVRGVGYGFARDREQEQA